MGTPPRLRTTTRDREQLARRLELWLVHKLPGVVVSNVRVPESNGMSSETLLFDLDHPDLSVRGWVLRLAADPAAYTVFPGYDMAGQFQLLRDVAGFTDVPVPKVLWLEESPDALGAPFFVMERVDGHVPPDVMPYTYGGNWLHAATDKQREALEASTVGVLARLHDQFPVEQDDRALLRHVAASRSYYEWVVQGRPRSALIEAGFDRLDAHWPARVGETVQNWGDARIGNIIYRDFEAAAVLDWEMAAAAPREVDLGWMIYLHRFFQDLTVDFGQPGLPGFLTRADIERRYAQATGYRPHDMDWYTLYAALRHASIMLRIAYRQVHFGDAVVPEDPDKLILHHATLVKMMEGTYWG